jgi:ABC-type nitrate/sulfonate/bicarbonate transport system substrate-binding protein
VKTFADLKKLPGRLKFSTITVNICVDFLTNKLAEKYGVPLDKIEWVTMPDIQAIQALKQGLVDIAGVHPPFYKGMDDAGAVKIADSLETGLGPAAGVSYYYFRDDFISRYPGVVRGFVRAIGRGQAWIDAHPELTAKWVSEAIGVPVTASHYYPLHNDVLESEIDPWIADLEKHKVLPRGKIHAADLVTHRFETHELFTWN